jgi:ribosomal protein S27AE
VGEAELGAGGRTVLTDFTRFVIAPDRDTLPSRGYWALVTCTDCDWSGKAELVTNEVQRLACGKCGNVEKAYLGIPDEFVGVPCPNCQGGSTTLERETNVLGRIEVLRLFCPECDWEL